MLPCPGGIITWFGLVSPSALHRAPIGQPGLVNVNVGCMFNEARADHKVCTACGTCRRQTNNSFSSFSVQRISPVAGLAPPSPGARSGTPGHSRVPSLSQAPRVPSFTRYALLAWVWEAQTGRELFLSARSKIHQERAVKARSIFHTVIVSWHISEPSA